MVKWLRDWLGLSGDVKRLQAPTLPVVDPCEHPILTRRIIRHGTGDQAFSAFTGFVAIVMEYPPGTVQPWRECGYLARLYADRVSAGKCVSLPSGLVKLLRRNASRHEIDAALRGEETTALPAVIKKPQEVTVRQERTLTAYDTQRDEFRTLKDIFQGGGDPGQTAAKYYMNVIRSARLPQLNPPPGIAGLMRQMLLSDCTRAELDNAILVRFRQWSEEIAQTMKANYRPRRRY